MSDLSGSTANGPALEATGLRVRFGGVVALDGVDVVVYPQADVLGLIGPNGSGKTTLFNVLTGFVRAFAGEVRWQGQDVTHLAPYQRARRGLVRTFQESVVFPGLTLEENLHIALTAARRPAGPQATAHLAEYVHLSHLYRSEAPCATLSWGESRLLGIALALAAAPKLILLDEPFAGLSATAAAEFTSVLQELKQQRLSAILIDHELAHLLPLCDRLMVLDRGVKIAEGKPAQVIDDAAVRAAYLGY